MRMKYKSEVFAMEWTGKNYDDIEIFTNQLSKMIDGTLHIKDINGYIRVLETDMIIKRDRHSVIFNVMHQLEFATRYIPNE